MPRFLMRISYDGTCFQGWQKQPEGRTVQGEVERALGVLMQKEISLYGSGRTDTGVHAEAQYAHFDTPEPVDHAFICDRLRKLLPREIWVHGVFPVRDDFHARFDALWRQYRYQLLLTPDPMLRLYGWFPGYELDHEQLRKCVAITLGEHDFSGFSKKNEDLPHHRCTILAAAIERDDSSAVLQIRFRANRFLRSMIRGLVGAAVTVARRRESTGWFRECLDERKQMEQITLAPARGLILEKVFYPDSAF